MPKDGFYGQVFCGFMAQIYASVVIAQHWAELATMMLEGCRSDF